MSERRPAPRDPWDFSLEELTGEPRPQFADDTAALDARSCDLAASMSVVIGRARPIIDRYITGFGAVPYSHLQALDGRDLKLVFAETIPAGLESKTARERRGRNLRPDEFIRVRFDCDRRSGTVAVYDEATDLIVFPTTYTTSKPERPVLHETGHALTMPGASPRESLLRDLPPELDTYVREAVPDSASPEEKTRVATLEALAEGYVYYITGRRHRLPKELRVELEYLLRVRTDGSALRYEFDWEEHP
jgi:hypothetical protein